MSLYHCHFDDGIVVVVSVAHLWLLLPLCGQLMMHVVVSFYAVDRSWFLLGMKVTNECV